MKIDPNEKRTKVWPLYILSLILFVVALISYTEDLWTFAIVTCCISIILFLLAGFSQLLDIYPESRIYYFTILIALTAPLVIYSLALISKASKSGLVQVGLSGDWIGFAGSIIGGAMTMFALIFTIQHENNKIQREEELRLLPYLECVSVKNHEFNIWDTNIDLYFKNLSSNAARKITIDTENSSILIDGTQYSDVFSSIHTLNIIEYLPPDYTKSISLGVKLSTFKANDIEAVLKLKIKFNNQILKKEYTLDLVVTGYFNRKSNKEIFEFDEEDPIIENSVNL